MNNEDFSDIVNNFSNILKEKNIDLNNIMGGDNPPNNSEENFNIDIETIMKLKNVMSNTNNPRNQLLKSLKPYLENNKKEKLEQYIKIANLLSVLDSLNDQNTLKFLNNTNYDFILMIILFLLIF